MKRRAHLLSAALLPLAGALWVLRTSWASLGSAYLGTESQAHYLSLWRISSLPDALQGSAQVYWPYGQSSQHLSGQLMPLLAQPSTALFGPVLGVNLFLLLGLGLSAAVAGLVSYREQQDLAGASLAAAVMLLGPWPLLQLSQGHLGQSVLLFPMLFVGALLTLRRSTGWAAPVVAGVSLALSAYQHGPYGLFCAIGGLLFGLASLWEAGRGPRLLRLSAAGALAALLCLPLARTLWQAQTGALTGMLYTEIWTLEYLPLVSREGALLPLSSWQPLAHATSVGVTDTLGHELFTKGPALLPWALFPSAALALWKGARWPWLSGLVSAAGLTMLSVGPTWLLGDIALPNPLYVQLARHLGLLKALWSPLDAHLWVALGVPLICGLAVSWVPHPLAKWGAALLLLAGLALQTPALESWQPQVPAGYRCLAQAPQGALAELPYYGAPKHLYYQSVHGHPILGGPREAQMIFSPEASRTLLRDNVVALGMVEPTLWQSKSLPGLDAGLSELKELGFVYVVLQKDAVALGLEPRIAVSRVRQREAQMSAHLGAAVYSDARTAIFSPWGAPSPCQDSVEPDNQRSPYSTSQAEGVYVPRLWASPKADKRSRRVVHELRAQSGLPTLNELPR